MGMSWWSRREVAPFRSGSAAAVPPDLRLYAIGDVHGRSDLLRELHGIIAAAAAAAPEPRRRLVYLGDYVDRGPDSPGVLDLLAEPPLDGFERVCLRGNHEDAMIRFLDGDLSVAATWLGFGGAETLRSYGLAAPDAADVYGLMQTQRQLAAVLPPAHHRLLHGLACSHTEGAFLFAHAGVRPEVPLVDQSAHDLMWIRAPFLNSAADFGKIVVHGHSIVPQPEFHPNRIAIDTGAYATGRLTCLVIGCDGLSLLQT
jgi:serine/threonine protein phosphatase 1